MSPIFVQESFINTVIAGHKIFFEVTANGSALKRAQGFRQHSVKGYPISTITWAFVVIDYNRWVVDDLQ